MGLTSWDPLLGLMIQAERLTEPGSSGWTPPMDLLETPESYILTVDLPGLQDDDVAVTVEASRVMLSGRRAAPPESDVRYHRIERGHGRFARTLTFPSAIDVARVRSDCRDGVLTVTLPKAERPGGRQVEITEGDTSR